MLFHNIHNFNTLIIFGTYNNLHFYLIKKKKKNNV